MATLFHLVFDILRISILSLIYGILVFYFLKKVIKIKSPRKTYLVIIIFLSLIIWRNSYWRNNGYGDWGRVPLTSKYEVTMIDFYWASIEKERKSDHPKTIINGIEKLYLQNDVLFGKTEQNYWVFNLKEERLISNLSEGEFLKENGNLEKLKDPEKFHRSYWGWKLLFF